jgi:hypothetical protein
MSLGRIVPHSLLNSGMLRHLPGLDHSLSTQRRKNSAPLTPSVAPRDCRCAFTSALVPKFSSYSGLLTLNHFVIAS